MRSNRRRNSNSVPLPHLRSHASAPNHPLRKRSQRGSSKSKAKGMDATAGAAPRKQKAPAADAAKKWPGGGDPARASPAAPPADAGGRGAALAECAVSCCVLCACVPVAALCCVARAPLRAARRCCCRWRRRPRRRLAPGGSSSFSDAEVGEFLQARRAMGPEDGRPPSSR